MNHFMSLSCDVIFIILLIGMITRISLLAGRLGRLVNDMSLQIHWRMVAVWDRVKLGLDNYFIHRDDN